MGEDGAHTCTILRWPKLQQHGSAYKYIDQLESFAWLEVGIFVVAHNGYRNVTQSILTWHCHQMKGLPMFGSSCIAQVTAITFTQNMRGICSCFFDSVMPCGRSNLDRLAIQGPCYLQWSSMLCNNMAGAARSSRTYLHAAFNSCSVTVPSICRSGAHPDFGVWLQRMSSPALHKQPGAQAGTCALHAAKRSRALRLLMPICVKALRLFILICSFIAVIVARSDCRLSQVRYIWISRGWE